MKIIAGMALALMAALPVQADQVRPGIMVMRDSDGIVISVLNPVNYFTPMPGGGVVYVMGGHVVDFSGSPRVAESGAGVLGPTAVVAGTTYQVEVSGSDVWLLDPATGLRHAARRVAEAGGLQVNPDGFAME